MTNTFETAVKNLLPKHLMTQIILGSYDSYRQFLTDHLLFLKDNTKKIIFYFYYFYTEVIHSGLMIVSLTTLNFYIDH